MNRRGHMAKRRIFVFGSNLAGRHGKGAARFARKYRGAVYGQGAGLQGDSYAIPTKDGNLRILALTLVKDYIDEFIRFARNNSGLIFDVTRVGCGLAGHTAEKVAPMFYYAPSNCRFHESWRPYLAPNAGYKYYSEDITREGPVK